MTAEKPKSTDEPQVPETDDVEGHNLWVNPSASREMTAGRSREIERATREHQRAKEAKEGRR